MTDPKTILVVDDDTTLLLALQKRLENAGWQVLTATNGPAALEQARELHPDAISLDVGLPGELSGLDVAAALQQEPPTAAIPILFVTGEANDEFKRKCQLAGGKYFLAKPYDPDLLLQVLRSMFGEDELSEAQRLSQAKRRQPVN